MIKVKLEGYGLIDDPERGVSSLIEISEDSVAWLRAGAGSNPTDSPDLAIIHGFCAAALQAVIIAKMDDRHITENSLADFEEAQRCFATALTHLETASMFATKGHYLMQKRKKD